MSTSITSPVGKNQSCQKYIGYEWGTEYHTIKSNNFGTSKLRHIRKPLSLNITTTTLKMKNLPTILLLVVTITIPYAAPLPIFREDEVSYQQLSLLMMPRPPYNEEKAIQQGDGQHNGETLRENMFTCLQNFWQNLIDSFKLQREYSITNPLLELLINNFMGFGEENFVKTCSHYLSFL
jgi:hypothetical protein